MKKAIVISLGALALGVVSSHAVTLQLSAFGAGAQTILGNSAGIATNGMTWGILVDTEGDGFGVTNTFDYGSALNPSAAVTSGLFAGTDDHLFLSSNLTTTFGGAAGSATQIIFNLNATVTGGEKYALVWFESTPSGGTIEAGGKYGIITNDALVIPASNAANESPTVLRGTTPVGGTTLTFVPEPSAALLGLLGAVGLIRRRR